MFVDKLLETRLAMDEAVGASEAATLSESLGHERSAVDAQLASAGRDLEATGRLFYKCFTAYSHLIKLVLSAQITGVVMRQQMQQRPRG